MHGSYLQDWLLSANSSNWRVSVELGGPSRAFADIGSHWCDLAEWVTGQRIVELCATIKTVVTRRPISPQDSFAASIVEAPEDRQDVKTEDVACLIFQASGGVVGTLTVSQVAAGRKNRLYIEIDGREGSVTFDGERPDRLLIGRVHGNEELIREPSQLSREARRVTTLPAGHHEGFVDNFVAFLKDVYSAVRGEARRYPNFDDGARSAHITEAVLHSSQARGWVTVEPRLLKPEPVSAPMSNLPETNTAT